MPVGFNRLGQHPEMSLIIEKTFVKEYDMWNIPVWKHLNENGHTLVRGLRPRKNEPFLHIYLEDCMNKIKCPEIDIHEVTQEEIDYMD